MLKLSKEKFIYTINKIISKFASKSQVNELEKKMLTYEVIEEIDEPK